MAWLRNTLANLTTKRAILTIVILGAIVHFNLFFAGPVIDFPDYTSTNPLLQSLSNLPSFFTYQSDSIYGQQILRERLQNYYRPVMLIVISFIYTFSGDSPFLYNLFLVSLHIFNACLVFVLFKHFFKIQNAFFLSIIFLIHPINIEAATFIGIADLLFFCFGLLCFLVSQKKDLKSKDLVIIFCLAFLSLLSKETSVVFLFLAIVSRLIFRRKQFINLLFVLSAPVILYSILRFNYVIAGNRGIDFNPVLQSTSTERLVSIPAIISYYLTAFIFPHDLSVLQTWIITSLTFSGFYLPLILIISFFITLFLIGKKIYKTNKIFFSNYIFFIIWFLVALMPHLQLIPLIMIVADRWFYLPIVGLLGIIGVVSTYSFNINKNLTICIGLIIITILSVRSFFRELDWRDNFSLYSQDIKLHPNNYGLLINLGHEFFIRKEFAKAQQVYDRALMIAPAGWVVWNNLGTNYYGQRNFSQAEKSYLKSIELGNFELAFSNLAILYFEQKNFIKTREICMQAIKLYPNNPILLRLLALSESEIGNIDKAIDYAKKSDLINRDQYSQLVIFDLNNKKSASESAKAQ